jgi:hypothetical protein
MFKGSANVTGDATGGNATARVNADPRFGHLVTLMGATQLSNVTPGQNVFFSLDDSPTAFGFGDLHAETLAGICVASWNPPPLIQVSTWSCSIPNVDGDALQFAYWVYNFNIRARERVPLDILLASVPRAGIFAGAGFSV